MFLQREFYSSQLAPRGIAVREMRIDAPPDDAPDQQWIDWSALVGLFSSSHLLPELWVKRAAEAYLSKWALPPREES